MNVLVIDDDQDFCHLLRAHLSRKGHHVTVANDGIQGQRMARIEGPDLIIIDFQMPAGNGLTVISRLHANSETSSIPIVMLSGSVDDELTRRAVEEGAHGVLSKLTLTEDSLVEAIDSAVSSTPLEPESTSLFPGERL